MNLSKKRKRSKTVQLLRISAALIMWVSLGLTACGNTAYEEHAGTYVGTFFEMESELGYTGRINAEAVMEDGTYLELSADGRGKLFANGVEDSIKWSLRGEKLTVSGKKISFDGRLENDSIMLDILNGNRIYYEKDKGESPVYENRADYVGTYMSLDSRQGFGMAFSDSTWLELYDDNTCCLTNQGNNENEEQERYGSWEAEENMVTLMLEDQVFQGKFENGVLNIVIDSKECVFGKWEIVEK